MRQGRNILIAKTSYGFPATLTVGFGFAMLGGLSCRGPVAERSDTGDGSAGTPDDTADASPESSDDTGTPDTGESSDDTGTTDTGGSDDTGAEFEYELLFAYGQEIADPEDPWDWGGPLHGNRGVRRA